MGGTTRFRRKAQGSLQAERLADYTLSLGSQVQIGAGRMNATVVEVIPTYRVQLPDGGWLVVEAGQIKGGVCP